MSKFARIFKSKALVNLCFQRDNGRYPTNRQTKENHHGIAQHRKKLWIKGS